MNKIIYAPLCIFLWKKYHLVEKVLDEIISLKEFPLTKIYIFVDSSKKNSKFYADNQILINKVKKYEKYQNIKIIYRKKNFGLSKNIISGINEVIKKYNKIIILEDDLLVAKDFLYYMNKSLEEYKNNKSVISISAFNHSSYRTFINSNYKYDNFFNMRASSWGWATWKNRWDLFLKKIPIKEIEKNKKIIISNLGLDVYLSLIGINKKNKDLWAANWCFASLKNKLFTSYPVVSRVSNIGFDGSGQGGYSKNFENKLKIKRKKNLSFKKNITIDNYKKNQFIKRYNQNFILQYLKFFMPDPLKIFIKNNIYLNKN